VTVTRDAVTYTADGDVTFRHEGKEVQVRAGEELTFAIDPIEDIPAPRSPRPPRRHSRGE
jgi:alpha,alpha-trehalose phosphorylase